MRLPPFDLKSLVAKVNEQQQRIAGIPVSQCPFCGGPAALRTTAGSWSVECYNLACLTIGPIGETPEQAAEKWNTRVRG